MTKQEAASEGVLSLIKAAPQMVVFLVLVGGFLWFIDRSQGAKDLNSTAHQKLIQERIDTCHGVQEAGTAAMVMQTEAILAYSIALTDHNTALDEQSEQLMELIFLLKQHVREHGCVMPMDNIDHDHNTANN